jgi:O-antigen/teichoic acid export membrane protein
MLPIYTRYLTPADYGVVGLLVFAVALMEPFFGARFSEAMLKFYYQEQQEDKKRAVVSTCLIITGLVSGVVALTAFVARVPISNLLFGTAGYSAAVGIFVFVFLTQAIEYYGLTYLRIQQKPVLFVSISVSKLVLQLSLNIWLVAVLKARVMGVVLSGTISSAVYATVLAIYVLTSTGAKCELRLVKRMFVFSWPLWMSGLASLYIYSGNRYFIRIFGSLAEVGYYELASKFAMILGLVVWQPFYQFWETERFRYHKDMNGPEIASSVFGFVSTLLFVAGLGISLFAEPTIRLMSSEEFHQAAPLVPLLVFGYLFGFLTNFVNFGFIVTEKTGMISRNNYITVVIVTALNFAFIPRFGFLGAGCALAMAFLIQLILVQRAVRDYYDMNIRLRPVVEMLIISAIAYVIASDVMQSNAMWISLSLKLVTFIVASAVMTRLLLRSAKNRIYLSELVAPHFPVFAKLLKA